MPTTRTRTAPTREHEDDLLLFLSALDDNDMHVCVSSVELNGFSSDRLQSESRSWRRARKVPATIHFFAMPTTLYHFVSECLRRKKTNVKKPFKVIVAAVEVFLLPEVKVKTDYSQWQGRYVLGTLAISYARQRIKFRENSQGPSYSVPLCLPPCSERHFANSFGFVGKGSGCSATNSFLDPNERNRTFDFSQQLVRIGQRLHRLDIISESVLQNSVELFQFLAKLWVFSVAVCVCNERT